MAVKTNNIYGKITISNETVAKYVSRVAMDCYGVVDLACKNVREKIAVFLRIIPVKGIKVKANGDRLFIDASLIVKYGVSIKAVIEAFKESVKYKVEKFTGMIVDTINVTVVGVKR